MPKAPFLTTTDSASLVNLKRAPTPTDRMTFEQASEDVQFITLAFLREQQEIHLPGTTLPMMGYSLAAFALTVPAAVAVATVLGTFALQWVGVIILVGMALVLLVMRQDGGKTDQTRASAIVWYQALMGDLPPVREGGAPSLYVSATAVLLPVQAVAAQNPSDPEAEGCRTTHVPVPRGDEADENRETVQDDELAAETSPA